MVTKDSIKCPPALEIVLFYTFVKSLVCGNEIFLSVKCRDVGAAYMDFVWSAPEKWYSGTVLEWFKANIFKFFWR